jgi:hypothetical protein
MDGYLVRWGYFMRVVVRLCALLALSFPLAGCLTASDLNTASQALNVASSALNIANAVANDELPSEPIVVPAVTTRATPAPALRPTTARMVTPSGTTQRGAFEDCEKLYRANGLGALADQCAQRARNMGSIR